jgi:glutathione S-transferase
LTINLANRQFLLGGNFTVADAYTFTVVSWTNFVGIDLKPYPNVGSDLARSEHAQRCRKTLKAEGLLE